MVQPGLGQGGGVESQVVAWARSLRPWWAGRVPGQHTIPPEDWAPESWAGELMCSQVQGLWIEQGRGQGYVWEGGPLRECVHYTCRTGPPQWLNQSSGQHTQMWRTWQSTGACRRHLLPWQSMKAEKIGQLSQQRVDNGYLGEWRLLEGLCQPVDLILGVMRSTAFQNYCNHLSRTLRVSSTMRTLG